MVKNPTRLATETRSTTAPRPAKSRFAPMLSMVTSVAVGFLMRNAILSIGWAENRDFLDWLRVAGVLTLAGTISWWVGKLAGKALPAMVLGTLAGMAAGSFAHEPVPAAAGLVILTYASMRIVSRLIGFTLYYVFSVMYGATVGVGAHYLVTVDDHWTRYPQAGLLVLVAVGLAAAVSCWFGEDGDSTRSGRMKTAWNRMNRAMLLGAAIVGLGSSLYFLQGQDLEQLATQIRQPVEQEVEQRIEQWETASENLDTANKVKNGFEKFFNRD